jgi:hypothetical protein
MMGIGTAINVVAVLVGGGIVTLLVGTANFLELDRTSTQKVPTLTLVAVQ